MKTVSLAVEFFLKDICHQYTFPVEYDYDDLFDILTEDNLYTEFEELYGSYNVGGQTSKDSYLISAFFDCFVGPNEELAIAEAMREFISKFATVGEIVFTTEEL